MGFTREELANYEKQPPKVVSDKVSPFRGATPAKAADPGAVAAVAAGANLDATPGGAPATASAGTAPVADDLVVDEDGTLGDQSETGEGTSGETSESPTDLTDPGGDADPNADLTGEAEDEESAAPAPAKGSAQERIVELNDKFEGAMVFGKTVQEAYKTVLEENARLRAERSPGATAPVVAPPVVSEDPGPMPDITDAEINFDNDKYRVKMQEWSTKNARHQARALFQEMTGAAQANTLAEQVHAKAEAYTKEHPEFQEVVTNNPVLKANQLASDAGLAVARSPYMAELLMKFGSDPGYAIRVARMNPADQLLEVGEMIAAVKAEKKVGKTTTTTAPTNKTTTAPRSGAQPAARKSVSQAPPPPRPTTGGGVNKRVDPLDPNTSMDDFVRSHRSGKETARKENRRLRGLS
jgi:hypothetical protein